MKNEPDWMLQFRLKALAHFRKRPMPTWGLDLSNLDLEILFYYVRPAEASGKTWDEVPETIKNTFDKLGIPEAEQKFLAGVGAQYEIGDGVSQYSKNILRNRCYLFEALKMGFENTRNFLNVFR